MVYILLAQNFHIHKFDFNFHRKISPESLFNSNEKFSNKIH